MLIALAIKILRRDGIEQGFIHGGKHSNSIFPPAPSHGLVLSKKPSQYIDHKKMPLLHNEAQCIVLMRPNSVQKNEANAKLNLAGKSCLLPEQTVPSLLVHQTLLHKASNTANNNLLCNVNFSLERDHIAVPKLYDKQHLASVVTWGDATGSASHV